MSQTVQPFQNDLRTAAELARMLSTSSAPVSRQAMNKRLSKVKATATIYVRGNATKAWCWADLPENLRADLDSAATRQQYRDTQSLWTRPPGGVVRDESKAEGPSIPWQPSVPRSEIASEEWQRAAKLRDVLLPALRQLHDQSVSAEALHQGIVERYAKVFGTDITKSYARKLLERTLDHDSGREDWQRLDIYLPSSPRRRPAGPVPCPPVELELLQPSFHHLAFVLKTLRDPTNPGKPMAQAIWTAACRDLTEQTDGKEPGVGLVREVCDLIYQHAPHLCAHRGEYARQLNRKLKRWRKRNGEVHALKDGRSDNGQPVEIPQEDIDLLRHAAAFLHGGRLDEAWWEEYPRLSEQTRNHYPRSWRCPTKLRELVNPELLIGLMKRHQGKRYLKRITGYVKRRWERTPSMHAWAMDDCTLNIEVEHPEDGSLIQPQLIIAQDERSYLITGWSVDAVKGPNAPLVCAAATDGFDRHGVPHNLRVENGSVFGKSLLVNGKVDDQGRTVVAGLEAYGCKVRHFEPGNPTSKGQLEKTFDLLQRRLEKHPGYTGRLQQRDAPEEFKREGLEIRSGRAPASKYRYTWDEFVSVLGEIIEEFNNKPQRENLQGMSPKQAFEKFKDPSNPPIQFAPELRWMLANERYLVFVKIDGVRFGSASRYRVRGHPLTEHVGKELWAVVDRKDDSLVTFMSLRFTDPFTMAMCEDPDSDERSTSPGAGVLASERRKISENFKAIDQEYRRLESSFGNPRQTLLTKARTASQAVPQRSIEVSSESLAAEAAIAGRAMEEQREEIRQRRATRARADENLRRRGAALQQQARELFEREDNL